MEIDDEDDDGVIFKGSPLYQSLLENQSLPDELKFESTLGTCIENELAFADEHVTPLSRLATTVDSAGGGLVAPKVTKVNSATRLKTLQTRLMNFVSPYVASINGKLGELALAHLMTSPTIEEDDGEFLQAFIQPPLASQGKTHAWIHLFNVLIVVYACVCSYSRYLDDTLLNGHFQGIACSILLVLAALLIIVELFMLAWSYIHLHRCKNELAAITSYLASNLTFVTTCKKCLRLIQETELVSRGFTFVSHQAVLTNIENSLGADSTRQCPVLRKFVFTVNRDAVLNTRELTRCLFNLHPLDEGLDIKGNYLAYEALESYGPCLQPELTNDSAMLHQLTDGFSIAALKGVVQLYTMHQSELIKSLCLVYHQQPCFKGVRKLLIKGQSQLDDWSGSLQKSHDFHNSTWQSKQPSDRKLNAASATTPVEGIDITVHSLDLHLQAAITRVREVSKTLHEMGQSDGDIQSHDLVQMLQPIKSELESCKGCWEEALVRIEKATGKAVSGDENQPVLVEPANTSDQAPVSDTKSIEDYIIEDQVFEAYTDPMEQKVDFPWEKPITEAEKERKKLQRRETLRVFKELKSVISVRAIETNKREQAALSRMYPALHKQTTNQNGDTKSCDQESSNRSIENKSCDSSSSNEKRADLARSHHSDGKSQVTDESAIEQSESIEADPETIESPVQYKVCEKDLHIVPNEDKETSILAELEPEGTKTTLKDGRCRDVKTCKSYVTNVGVRRLRKRNMLDIDQCDSDSDRESSRDFDHSYYYEDEAEADYETGTERIGLPLFEITGLKSGANQIIESETSPKNIRLGLDEITCKKSETEEIREFETDTGSLTCKKSEPYEITDAEEGAVEELEHASRQRKFRLPTLQERIASEVTAKSRTFAKLEEDTFGADEEYGELSDEEAEADVSKTEVSAEKET